MNDRIPGPRPELKGQQQSQQMLDLQASAYAGTADGYDEMVAADGSVRPHWSNLASLLTTNSAEQWRALRRESERRLRDQGVYYNVYTDPAGAARTWRLDPLPMIIAPAEWEVLQPAIQQRARLFSHILLDLQGESRCLRNGLLPPELVYLHSAYYPALFGGAGQPMTLFASDLARGPDGNWWVVSDRTQGPSGIGYVMEARQVSNRVMRPEVQDIQPASLLPFLRKIKAHLAALAPRKTEDPVIVLMSSGVGNEVYFEHAYLANHLGITLAEGGDLTVRDGNVFLKTVDGLKQVDVIIRRVDDSFSDPLYCRGDSVLGVAGLVQAQKLGRIGLANPIGSAILESPGILPFLPRLARYFLNESLKINNVATWWCGQAAERQHVCSRIDDMVIKSIDRGNAPIFGGGLTKAEQAVLIAQINAQPWQYVGQQRLAFSTVPTFNGDELIPRHLVTRLFTVGNGAEYDVMPGGLTRVSGTSSQPFVSSQKGGLSKDTWVISEQTEPTAALIAEQTYRHEQAERGRNSPPVPLTSRAAENIYWMARYLERSQTILRLMSSYSELYDRRYEEDVQVEARLLNTLAICIYQHLGFSMAAFENESKTRLNKPLTVEKLARWVYAENVNGSITSNLRSVIRSGYEVRDLFSGDGWRSIENLEQTLKTIAKRFSAASEGNGLDRSDIDDMQRTLSNTSFAVTGATGDSLPADQGGLWLKLGRDLERAHCLTFLVARFIGQYQIEGEHRQLEELLRANDAYGSYRRRMGTLIESSAVFYHLLLDPRSPRSLYAILDGMEPLVQALDARRSSSGGGHDQLGDALFAALAQLRLAPQAVWSDLRHQRLNVVDVVFRTKQNLNQIGQEIDQRFFAQVKQTSRR
ncbi:circularly permuted type 2 ATP-grasp protein [Allohahella sp. A8]|uniref:circularly permuted type 2 ATP-grasp protein n=1 Tax=Allohahella sp. A8 TaxID=3141461 RepID=UPI003A7FBBC8